MEIETCFQCHERCPKSQIIRLEQCNHQICKKCLAGMVLSCADSIIKCPKCNKEIQQSEIKQVLDNVQYEAYLDRTFNNLSSQPDTFQCTTKGCSYLTFYEDGVREMTCFLCEKTSCLLCKAQHLPLTCFDFEEKLKKDTANTENENYAESLRILNVLQSSKENISLNTEEFDCLVCFETIKEGDGIRIQRCGHTTCRGCLIDYILSKREGTIHCSTGGECKQELNQHEIKALLTEEQYAKHLDDSLNQALREADSKNKFYCKTINCNGFCFFDDNAVQFQCEICEMVNCLRCNVIHFPRECKTYQDELNRKAANDEQAQKSIREMEKKIQAGSAMRCPNCNCFIMKTTGCDWLLCSCKTEICWATKGPRWGPKGQGDTSGGCGCQPFIKPCHVNCQFCH